MKRNCLPLILSIFRTQIGTTEDPPKSNMTKYGEKYGWNGQPWCVMFLWWGFDKAGESELFFDGGKTASCGELMYWAQGKGIWVTENYQSGDLIIMDFPNNSTTTDHIGIVEKVEGNILYTIEGNTSPDDKGSQSNGDGVYAKKRDITKTKIVGAVRINYIKEEETPNYIKEELSLARFKLLWHQMRQELQDNEASSWSKEAREWAIDNKIINSTTGKYAWEDVLTREQLITVLFRFSKYLEEKDEKEKGFSLFKKINK